MPNSWTRDAGPAGHDEVAELVGQHERHDDGQQDGDVDEEVHQAVRPRPDVGPAGPGTDLGVDGLELLERRARRLTLKRATASSTSRAMPVNDRLPARNRATATSSAAMSAAVAPGTGAARRARHGEGREARSSGASKVMWPCSVRSSRGAGPAVALRDGRAAYWMGMRMSGRPKLRLQRAVHELDERVDQALGMDDDIDVLVGDIVEPVGLDDLQALVHERGRVDGDLGAHVPGRVGQGVLGARRPPGARPATRGRARPRP